MEGPGAAIWEPAPHPRPQGLEGLRQTDILQTDRADKEGVSETERPDRLTGDGERDKNTKRRTGRRERAGQRSGEEGKGKERRGEESRVFGPQHQEPLKLQAVSPGPGVRPGHQHRRGQARSMNGPALLRRNASKRGLEKLLRLTAQWEEEDQEEAAREQRQREQEKQLQDQDKDEDEGDRSLEQTGQQTLLRLKSSELDEDEGFGDWSQKVEQRQQTWGNEGTAEGSEPSQSEGPEKKQAEDSSHQTNVHLEKLCLSQGDHNPEDAVGNSGETDEHLTSHPARTPSPLALEETVELSSPPLSPTSKLADRTESLNRSIQKSNSVKKSQPTLPISTIDERLQQYTQATESAGRTPKLSRQPSIELPSMAVASTKTRWETGEVQTQSASKTPSCQDIVAGDMSKKSLWEQKGGSKTSSTIKSTPSGKRYKFVATGHGKYEKVLVDDTPAP